MKRLFLSIFLSVILLPVFSDQNDDIPKPVIQNGHADTVSVLGFHPGGEYLASAGGGTVKIWSVDGILIRTFRTSSPPGAYKVSFSPDGKYLAYDNGGSSVELRRITGEQVCVIQGHGGFAFAPGGHLVTWAAWLPWGSDKTNKEPGIKIWTLDGKLQRIIEMKGHTVIKTADRISGKETVQLLTFAGDTVRGFEIPGGLPLAFSPDSRYIAVRESVMFSHAISVWGLEGDNAVRIEGHWQFAFSPGGRYMASVPHMGSDIHLWTIQGEPLLTLAGHEREITSFRFTRDGEYLASSSKDKTIRLWSSSGGVVRTYEHQDELHSLAMSPDHRYIAAGGKLSSGGFLNIWNYGGEPSVYLPTKSQAISEVSFSPEGRYIATGEWDNGVQLWSVRDGLLWRKSGPDLQCSSPTHTVFSSDGGSLKTRYDGAFKTVKEYWSVPGGEPFSGEFTPRKDSRLRVHAYSASAGNPSVISPDGEEKATVFREGSKDIIKFWTSDRKPIRSYELNANQWGHNAAWLCVSFSPGWKYLANGTWKNTVRLWTPEGELLRTFEGHTMGIYSTAFSPDGNYLISGSLDHTMRIWDIDTSDWVELTLLSEDVWVASHSSGRFYCGVEGKPYIRFIQGMEIFPADMYWDTYFTPGLVEKFLHGIKLPEIAKSE